MLIMYWKVCTLQSMSSYTHLSCAKLQVENVKFCATMEAVLIPLRTLCPDCISPNKIDNYNCWNQQHWCKHFTCSHHIDKELKSVKLQRENKFISKKIIFIFCIHCALCVLNILEMKWKAKRSRFCAVLQTICFHCNWHNSNDYN